MEPFYTIGFLWSTNFTRIGRRFWDSGMHHLYSPTQETITVRQLKDLVSLRSGLSEDSDVAVVSAFRARALLITRYTFPVSLIFDQLEDLLAIFEQKFVTRKMLSCTQRTLWKFFKQRVPPTRHNLRRYGHRMRTLFDVSSRQGQ